ncbi:hypothetical protein P8625_03465 [Tenacibaculum tangerinum]|uniref:Lipoprotein n=1 Tax=Tenacibaculum tangerinum TaxID=3038772 RepID=A0ABY8L485_9FLAO|nr:hypothetical protein [Tenacibaculum tangerinum]WGH76237.1 hypothetical protein P8625_03465 [Tenacibaculum tangerinum]
MKKTTFYRIPFLLLLIISCSKQPKERVLTIKDVFPTQHNTDSTFVFDLDTVKNFESLTSVFCENYDDRKIKYYIRTSKNDIPFYINSMILCEKAICGLIKYRNVLFIDNYSDSLFFHNDISYNFNKSDFRIMLEKQFCNYSANPEFADSPDKSLIFLGFIRDLKNSEIDLKNKLDTISISYFHFLKSLEKKNIDSLRKVYPLQIRLDEMIEIVEDSVDYVQPPIPDPLEIIE